MNLAADLSHARVLRFTTHIEPLITASDAIITMGGYNSMMEAHSMGKRVVVIPRVFPRREQWMRAKAFEQLGLLSVIEPDQLCVRLLADVTEKLLNIPAPRTPAQIGISWDGARNFVNRIEAIRNQFEEQERHGHEQLLRA